MIQSSTPFSMNFRCTTTIYEYTERCNEGEYEKIIFYHPENWSKKQDLLKQETGIFYKEIGPANFVKDRVDDDVVMYEPFNFEPVIWRKVREE